MAESTLTSILMLDVVGSMAMWERDRDSASHVIAKLERIVEECATRNDGHVHKKRGEGDSFFLTFSSPLNSVRSAVDLLREIEETEWGVDCKPILRAAIRTGECELRGGDLFGPTVNRCARMRSAAAPGQIVVCEATKSIVGPAPGSGIQLLDIGTHTLRDAPSPEQFFTLAVEGMPVQMARIGQSETSQHNLPARATSFIGREKEIQLLDSALRSSRLVTLVGPGGCGKTRLSEVGADQFVGEFRDGVWFVALADCRAVDAAPALIAKAIPQLGLADPTWDSLVEALGERHLLLLLDNCEQLIPDITMEIRRLVQGCARLRILATSRRPFNLNEEAVVPVAPFSVDDLDLFAGDLEAQPAFSLFWSRASAKDPNLRLDASNATAIIGICRQLSGIPLALEQAASYAGRLSPTQIEERLHGKLGMLKSAPGSVDSRHETMRATIEWSIDLLTPKARELVYQLGVFSGGWSFEAVERIVENVHDAFDTHDELVDSSLVTWTDDELVGRRYRFLEPIREHIVESGRVKEETRSQWLDWLLEFAEHVDRELSGPNQSMWIRRAELELENLRSALQALLDAGDDRLPQFANSLKRLWLRTGLYREGAQWIERALQIELSDSSRLRATLLNALGACISRGGDSSLAEERYLQSLEIWTTLGDRTQMASALTNMAILAADRKDFQRAKDLYARGAELFEESADARGLGIALMNCSYMEILQENWAAAKETTDRAVALLRQSNDLQNLAFAIGNRANALWELGETEAYAQCAKEQLEIIEGSHDPYPLGLALASIAVNGARSAEVEVARKAFAALDQLRGFDTSFLQLETQRRLENARNAIEPSGMRHPAHEIHDVSEFHESIESARELLDEFIRATCGKSTDVG